MAFDAESVYASRDVILYRADYAATTDLPDDDVDWGDDWGAPWVQMGYTQDGVMFSITTDRGAINVDQELDAVLRPITGRDITLSSNLAQFTVENMQAATGQGDITALAPTALLKGHNLYEFTSVARDLYGSWAADFRKNYDGEPLRVFLPKGLPTGAVETTMGNAEANLQIPFEVSALPDTSVSPARILNILEVLPTT
jgi:hypothetical protein